VVPVAIIKPLLVVVGQTATGKSSLALELAERCYGEIICADSRTVYRGMDIGTAKPTAAEQKRVRHHCIDLIDPDGHFTAADFKRFAVAAMDDITWRGRMPILVGGTGLYIDAILYDYSFRTPADTDRRKQLDGLSVAELQKQLRAAGIALPNNPQNPRHLVRALETGGKQPERAALRQNTLVIGLQLDKEELAARIVSRVDAMLQAGLEDEVRRLFKRYGFDIPPMQTIGYQEWQEYFNGVQNLEQTRKLIIRNTRAYAKRQRTWFKRNNSVQWISNREDIEKLVALTTTHLSK
jgi:tRNA dimethylallyltransferase